MSKSEFHTNYCHQHCWKRAQNHTVCTDSSEIVIYPVSRHNERHHEKVQVLIVIVWHSTLVSCRFLVLTAGLESSVAATRKVSEIQLQCTSALSLNMKANFDQIAGADQAHQEQHMSLSVLDFWSQNWVGGLFALSVHNPVHLPTVKIYEYGSDVSNRNQW